MPKILIVEDEQNLIKIYNTRFHAEGWEVIFGTTGQEGVLLAKTQKPQLILLDVMLPGGQNGFDTLEKLKLDLDTKNIPVIILTNLDTEKETALSIGAADYIVKTAASIDDIVTKIKSYVPQMNS